MTFMEHQAVSLENLWLVGVKTTGAWVGVGTALFLCSLVIGVGDGAKILGSTYCSDTCSNAHKSF